MTNKTFVRNFSDEGSIWTASKNAADALNEYLEESEDTLRIVSVTSSLAVGKGAKDNDDPRESNNECYVLLTVVFENIS